MRKLWIAAILVILLLAGCTDRQPEETTPPPTTENTAPTETEPLVTEPEDPGIYVADGELESSTGGAIREYRIEGPAASAIAPMGEGVLVFTSRETTTLTAYSGEKLVKSAETEVPCYLHPVDGNVQVAAEGVGYYDADANSVVILDAQLNELSRTELPEETTGGAVLSPDLKTVYYCTDNTVRAMDLETGISRMVREMTQQIQMIRAIHADGSVLQCLIVDEEGSWTNVYMSADTGKTLYIDTEHLDITTAGNSWFVPRQDGSVLELLFSLDDQEVMCLNPGRGNSYAAAVLELGGVVVETRSGDGYDLDFYDLSSGSRKASLWFAGDQMPWQLTADDRNGCIWFLKDQTADQTQLCRWDPDRSRVEDEAVYIAPRFTAQNPDSRGLEECKAKVAAISERYGVDVRIWEDMAFTTPEYTFTAEYQAPAYRRDLEALDKALAGFPEGFLKEAAKGTESGVLHIELVRDIAPNAGFDVRQSVRGIQFWDGAEAVIVLTMGETLQQSFFRQLSYVIDNRVLGKSLAYDEWEKLNPKGFRYTYTYEDLDNLINYSYLSDDNRYFADPFGMTFPAEDRAAILEYAMMPNMEDYFRTEAMQNKLRRIGTGIRQAFGLKKSTDVFLWEQYLEEPLAPSK